MRAVPARDRVRRETRMHHRKVRRVVGITQIPIKTQQLTRRQHALVDAHLAPQAADVELLGLLQGGVAAQPMARALAQQIKLTREPVALAAVRRSYEELPDVRRSLARAL